MAINVAYSDEYKKLYAERLEQIGDVQLDKETIVPLTDGYSVHYLDNRTKENDIASYWCFRSTIIFS